MLLPVDTPNPPETVALLALWCSECQEILRDSVTEIAGSFRAADAGASEPDFVCQLLSNSCYLTSESALLLVGFRRLWDVEILIRSVVEGTYKFIYLCLGN